MIIKGGSCAGAGRLAAHLFRADHNERVEVQARTASICENIAAEFARKIRLARKMLPRGHMAAAVAALKQAKREAVKFVRESAKIEIKERKRKMQKKAYQNIQNCYLQIFVQKFVRSSYGFG